MKLKSYCPECCADWSNGLSCEDHFHQMLFWEAERPALGMEVHHLMVLAYHLQHPHLYSPDGLRWAMQLLYAFMEQAASPETIRRRGADSLDSGKRGWKVTGTTESHGKYSRPVVWRMTAADVVTAGIDAYCDSVRAWARSVYNTLAETDLIPVA